MQNHTNIDLFRLLIISLATCNLLQRDIEKTYEENEEVFYRLYHESQYFNDPLFQALTTKNMELAKKLTGILLWQNNNDVITMRLIKKGYKFTYTYVTQHKFIEISDFTEKWCLRKNQDTSKMVQNLVILFYLCQQLGKEYDFYKPWTNFMWSSVLDMASNKKDSLQEALKKYRAKVENEKVLLNFPQKSKMTVLEILASDFGEKATIGNAPNSLDDAAYHLSQDNSLTLGCIIGSTSFIRLLGIDAEDLLQNTTIDQDQINIILAHLFHLMDERKIEESEKRNFLVFCIYLYALNEEYKQTREKFLEGLKDRIYYELSSEKESLEKDRKKFKRKEEQLNKEKLEIEKLNQSGKEALRKTNEELNRVNRINQEQEKRIQELERNEKELYALREYVFSLQQEKEYPELDENKENNFNEMIHFLNEKRCAIFGGHPGWQNKLKEFLPNFTFIAAEEKGRDFTFINSYDGVFINTAYNSHSTYNKIMSVMRVNDVPLFYINDTTNFERTIKHIFDKLRPKTSVK